MFALGQEREEHHWHYYAKHKTTKDKPKQRPPAQSKKQNKHVFLPSANYGLRLLRAVRRI
jgi:hypothetical protein